ncbi:MAG: copper-binding protein [Planctomycetota bacterium]|nr:copper-binding protein [Planctomycetota bacterium]
MKLFTSVAIVSLACSLVAIPAGCSKDPSQDTPAAKEKRPVRAYDTRGRIVALPKAPDPKDSTAKPVPPTQRIYSIRHERIEKFEDSKGRVSPMRAMVMKFSPAEGVDMTTLKEGDAVNFTFEVHWDNDPEHILKVTKFSVLPADTKLEFDKPKEAPAASTPSAGATSQSTDANKDTSKDADKPVDPKAPH